mmetsp:Transcript_35720/g.64797  ORF Transcript_35720/g.64797 Transcript_35720/m.64797 type:complete len:470 (-) Transcript_35720:262-1671(-)
MSSRQDEHPRGKDWGRSQRPSQGQQEVFPHGGRGSKMDSPMAEQDCAKAVGVALAENNLQKALHFLKQGRKKGYTPSLKVYSNIMCAAAKKRNFQEGQTLREMMKADEVELDRVGYTLLMQISRGQDAMVVFDEMVKHGHAPDAQAYTVLIDAFSHEGAWKRALRILEDMKSEGMDINKIHVTTALKCFRTASTSPSWKQALNLFESMKDQGIEPDVACFNSMMQVLKNAGQWDQALQMMEDMQSSSRCQPDLISFSLAAGSCKEIGDSIQAMGLLRKAHKQELRLDASVYKDLMETTIRSQKWPSAFEVFASFLETGLKVTSDLQRAVLVAAKGLSDSGQESLSLSRDECRAILVTHQAVGNFVIPLELLHKMKGEGSLPGVGYTFQMTEEEAGLPPMTAQSSWMQRAQPAPRFPHSATYIQPAHYMLPMPLFQQYPQADWRNPQGLLYGQEQHAMHSFYVYPRHQVP